LNTPQTGIELLANIIQKLRGIISIAVHRHRRLSAIQFDQVMSAVTAIFDDFRAAGLQELQELLCFHGMKNRTLMSFLQGL